MPEVLEAPVEQPQQQLPLADGVDQSRQNNVEQAPTAAPEAKPEEVKAEAKNEDTPEQAAQRELMRQRRKLERAYRQKAEAEGRLSLREKELEELRKPKTVAVEGEPRLEQFDYDPEKYAAAKADFARTNAAKEFETKQRTEAQNQAHQKLVSGWEEKAERGADKYDDWQEKVGELKPTSPWSAALMEADNAEDIAHYLGSNPKEIQRILQLPPLSQVREIGKIEAKLLATPPKAAAPSKAPAPIVPLKGTGNTESSEPSESDDIGPWMKKRNAKVHGRRR